MNRGELVRNAMPAAGNPFALVHLAVKCARLFHNPRRQRIQESLSGALERLGRVDGPHHEDAGLKKLGDFDCPLPLRCFHCDKPLPKSSVVEIVQGRHEAAIVNCPACGCLTPFVLEEAVDA